MNTDPRRMIGTVSPRARAIMRNRELAERGLRWCPRCESAKPLGGFYAGGATGYCRRCDATRRRGRSVARAVTPAVSAPDVSAPTAVIATPVVLRPVPAAVASVAGLDRGSWPAHLRSVDLDPVAVLDDDAVAAGYALANAALPLGRGWNPAGWHVGGRA